MPTRPTKGDHGHADSGSQEQGNQKAVTGSGVSPDVAEARKEMMGTQQDPAEPDT